MQGVKKKKVSFGEEMEEDTKKEEDGGAIMEARPHNETRQPLPARSGLTQSAWMSQDKVADARTVRQAAMRLNKSAATPLGEETALPASSPPHAAAALSQHHFCRRSSSWHPPTNASLGLSVFELCVSPGLFNPCHLPQPGLEATDVIDADVAEAEERERAPADGGGTLLRSRSSTTPVPPPAAAETPCSCAHGDHLFAVRRAVRVL